MFEKTTMHKVGVVMRVEHPNGKVTDSVCEHCRRKD